MTNDIQEEAGMKICPKRDLPECPPPPGISSKDILSQYSSLGGTIFRGKLYAYYLLQYSIPLRRKISYFQLFGQNKYKISVFLLHLTIIYTYYHILNDFLTLLNNFPKKV